jgi:hypothetical protein
MKSQRQSVFEAVCCFVGAIPDFNVLPTCSKEDLKEIHKVVLADFRAGNVELKGVRTDEWLTKYVPGLVNNWMRKDTRLTGGQEYVAKNPGSRTGSGDESLKAMKALLAQVSPDMRPLVQAGIDAKLEEIAASKVQPINVDALPEHLRALVPAVAPVIRKTTETK